MKEVLDLGGFLVFFYLQNLEKKGKKIFERLYFYLMNQQVIYIKNHNKNCYEFLKNYLKKVK